MRTIETKRYILKLVEKKNANKIFKILSNPQVIENLNMDIHTQIEDTLELLNDYYKGLEKGEKYPYEILDKVTGDFIGIFLIKLDLFDEDCYEFTIYLDEQYWGKGIYTEILPYMTQVAFEDIVDPTTGELLVEKDSVISEEVAEKVDSILSLSDNTVKSSSKTVDNNRKLRDVAEDLTDMVIRFNSKKK